MLTIGQLKQIIADYNLPDDSVICVPIDSSDISSIDIHANVMNITHAEHSYGKRNIISFITSPKYTSDGFTIRSLIGRNQWNERLLK